MYNSFYHILLAHIYCKEYVKLYIFGIMQNLHLNNLYHIKIGVPVFCPNTIFKDVIDLFILYILIDYMYAILNQLIINEMVT